jgi:hypothetical protein
VDGTILKPPENTELTMWIGEATVMGMFSTRTMSDQSIERSGEVGVGVGVEAVTDGGMIEVIANDDGLPFANVERTETITGADLGREARVVEKAGVKISCEWCILSF